MFPKQGEIIKYVSSVIRISLYLVYKCAIINITEINKFFSFRAECIFFGKRRRKSDANRCRNGFTSSVGLNFQFTARGLKYTFCERQRIFYFSVFVQTERKGVILVYIRTQNPASGYLRKKKMLFFAQAGRYRMFCLECGAKPRNVAIYVKKRFAKSVFVKKDQY